jgi:hypothetical protein
VLRSACGGVTADLILVTGFEQIAVPGTSRLASVDVKLLANDQF